MKKIISHILVLSLLFITSCGFRVLNQNELNNFNIIKIETSGDKRINFKIKNNLATQAQRNSNNNIEIRISIPGISKGK